MINVFLYFILPLALFISIFKLMNTVVTLITSNSKTRIKAQRKKNLKLKLDNKFDSGIFKDYSSFAEDKLFPWFNNKIKEVKRKTIDDINFKISISRLNGIFTAETYIISDYALKLIAGVSFIILAIFYMSAEAPDITNYILVGMPFFIIGASLQVILNVDYNAYRDSILLDFPNFIRYTGSFLGADYNLSQALAKTKPFLHNNWQELIKQMLIIERSKSQMVAFEYLKENCAVEEVEDFVVLLKISNGSQEMEAIFEKEAEHVDILIDLEYEKVISSRNTKLTALQIGMVIIAAGFIMIPMGFTMWESLQIYM